MKKIILLLLIVLVSCQKDDINGSIVGTETEHYARMLGKTVISDMKKLL